MLLPGLEDMQTRDAEPNFMVNPPLGENRESF